MVRSGLQTSDGGYILAGSFIAAGSTYQDFYIMKIDEQGTICWTKSIGDTSIDYATNIKPTFDGGFIIIGRTYDTVDDALFIKTDSVGNVLWSHRYGDWEDLYVEDVEQTTDSGFIFTGKSYMTSPCCRADAMLLKTDGDGNFMWSKVFTSYDDEESGATVKQTSTEKYIMVGSYGYYNSLTSIFFVKANTLGQKIWARTYGTGYGFSVVETYGGNYYIAGSDNVSNGATIIKTDSMGITQWKKVIKRTGEENTARSIILTTDSALVVVGLTGHFGANDYFMCKLNLNGDTLWTRTYGGPGDDIALCVRETYDHGFIIFGNSNSFGSSNSNIYLIKTDSSGNSNCNELQIQYTIDDVFVTDPIPNVSNPQLVVPQRNPTFRTSSTPVSVTPLCFSMQVQENILDKGKIKVFPNPSSESFKITLPYFCTNGFLQIFNSIGEIIFEKEIINSITETLYFMDKPKGVYFLRVFDGGYYFEDLLIKQ